MESKQKTKSKPALDAGSSKSIPASEDKVIELLEKILAVLNRVYPSPTNYNNHR